jgi:hypothetical protein
VQAGLAAGKSTLGVCANSPQVNTNPEANTRKDSSIFEFIIGGNL